MIAVTPNDGEMVCGRWQTDSFSQPMPELATWPHCSRQMCRTLSTARRSYPRIFRSSLTTCVWNSMTRTTRLAPSSKFFCEFIDRGRQAGSVVVHCHGAISRSPAVILAYLCHHGQSLRQAAQHLGAIVATLPNDIFFWQIAKYFGEQLTSATLREIQVTLGQTARCQHSQGGE